MSKENKGLAWKGEWHTAVPDGLLNSPMSTMAKFLWICLKSFASKDSPKPFPSRHTLCKMCAVTRNTLDKYRNELVKHGWVEVEQRRSEAGDWMSNLYTLCVPEKVYKSAHRGPNNGPPLNGPPLNGPPLFGPHKESHTLEGYPPKKEDHQHQGRASAPNGGVGPASQASQNGHLSPEAYAKAFLSLWCGDYQKWFGVRYRPAASDHKEAVQIFEDYPGKRLQPVDLMFLARKMWLATKEKDSLVKHGHDPLFYSFKAQSSVRFFLAHIEDVAEDVGETIADVFNRITEKDVEELDCLIEAGRNAE